MSGKRATPARKTSPTVAVERMSKAARIAFGKQVKEARDRLGWSQGQLAEKAGGIHQAYISHIEHGTYNTRIDTMAAIAVALGLRLNINLD